jgi:hypothetical protein
VHHVTAELGAQVQFMRLDDDESRVALLDPVVESG